MRISLEWFLLDNLVMDLLILRLASVFAGARFRLRTALPFAGLGALYAALAISVVPEFNHLLARLLLGACMSIPLMRGRRSILRAILSLYLAAFLSGGLMLAFGFLFGGKASGNAVIGTTPLRAVLLATLALVFLPRMMRELIALYRARERLVQVRVRMEDRVLQLSALLDSGNLVLEPYSGKMLLLVQPGLLEKGGRPAPYRTIHGEGMLFAQNAQRVEAYFGQWIELDVMVAESPKRIQGADAILPGIALEKQRKVEHDRSDTQETIPAVPQADRKAGPGALLHLFRRNLASAVSARGGARVDRAPDAR